MNAFLSVLESNKIPKESYLKRTELTTLQVNMGNLCNQSCVHCHVDASPKGNKVISAKVVDDILSFLKRNKDLVLDITGGAPELNPNFDYLVTNAQPLVKEIIVRTNLTIIFEANKEYLPEFYKKNKVYLICSLPGFKEEEVALQRGAGVFKKSIDALKKLNEIGYAKNPDLLLDIVYNPQGAQLPPKKDTLEKVYKLHLKGNYKIDFGKLIMIINAPIKRFRQLLDANGEYKQYINLLKQNFNSDVVENIMCRQFLSVGCDGKLYDCDFNQALGWALKDEKGKFLAIDMINVEDLVGRDIMVGEHCFSCTAGYGSSCKGALVEAKNSFGKIDAKETAKEYYGKVLKTSGDLKTNACVCAIDAVSKYHRSILNKIHPEVVERFYGCGSPIPPLLEGCTVLDLGCGTGRDVYLASYLVGEKGRVIGIDMTDEQLDIARKYVDYHTKEFCFSGSNVKFIKGYIENLEEIKDGSIDAVISNCVINLSYDKRAVFKEISRVLKPGSELYFSDIFADRRIPEHIKSDPILYGECLGGALYIEDFRRILKGIGCPDYRVVSNCKITLNSPEIENKVGMIRFYSMTIRAFKLDDLEDICEDYGQVATYLGTISSNPHQFILDDHHIFVTAKPMLICGNTASMLSNTRYAKYFKVIGDRSVHYGPFKCNTNPQANGGQNIQGGSCC